MGHLQTIESELRRLIAEGDTEALVAWVKERIVESELTVLRAHRIILSAAGSPPQGRQPRKGAPPSNLPV